MAYLAQIVVVAIITLAMGALQSVFGKGLKDQPSIVQFFGSYAALALPMLAALWLVNFFLGSSGFYIYTSAVVIGFLVGIASPLVYSLYKDQFR